MNDHREPRALIQLPLPVNCRAVCQCQWRQTAAQPRSGRSTSRHGFALASDSLIRSCVCAHCPQRRTKPVREQTMSNDDMCSICAEGGILVCCEECPRSYHFPCASLDEDDTNDEPFRCEVCVVLARHAFVASVRLLLCSIRTFAYSTLSIFLASLACRHTCCERMVARPADCAPLHESPRGAHTRRVGQ